MKKDTDKPLVYQIEYKNEDGSVDIWKYDMRIRRNGPVEVTYIPPKPVKVIKKKRNKYIKDDQDE